MDLMAQSSSLIESLNYPYSNVFLFDFTLLDQAFDALYLS